MLDRVRCLLVVPILVLLGGCLETEDLLVLNADGTGTFTATYVADTTKVKAVFERVRELYPDNFRGSRLPKNMPQPFHRNWFELVSKAAKGVKITAGASVLKEGLRTSTIQATFDTLKSAVINAADYTGGIHLSIGVLSDTPGPGTRVLDVGDAVREALDRGLDRADFRLRFALRTNNDDRADLIMLNGVADLADAGVTSTLHVTYQVAAK